MNFVLTTKHFPKYPGFDRFAGQTSSPPNACIDKDEFNDFWCVSNSCGIALTLRIKVRMRQAASLYSLAMSRLDSCEFETLAVLARACGGC